jgi:hypothetical protein
MKAILYRYPHPRDSTRFIYVGQQRGRDRDARHRRGYEGFGKRFKEKFPGIELPHPVREEIEIKDHLELNELETIWMFQYHTWCAYPDGMNLCFPGSLDYQSITAMACRARAALPAERQSEIMTRVSHAATSEERSAWGRRVPISVRKAAKKKQEELLGPEGRSAAARKRAENLGSDRLKEIAAKGLATRRLVKEKNVRRRPEDSSPRTSTCE